MYAKPNKLVATTAGVIVALALAACSSSGGTTRVQSTSKANHTAMSSDQSPTATTGTDAPALVPKSIRAKGTLIVGMEPDYPPEEFMAADGRTIIGVDPDIAMAVGKKLNLKVTLKGADFSTLIPGLQSGKYDLAISGMFDTKEREKVVDLIDYYKTGEAFYVKADSKISIEGLQSLCGKKVAVLTGSSELTDAQDQAKKCSLTVLSFAKQTDADLAVSSGRADIGFVDQPTAVYLVQKSNGQFKITGPTVSVVPNGIAVPKGNGMVPAVIAALKSLIADGTYMKILTKWGMEGAAITEPTVNGADK